MDAQGGGARTSLPALRAACIALRGRDARRERLHGALLRCLGSHGHASRRLRILGLRRGRNLVDELAHATSASRAAPLPRREQP